MSACYSKPGAPRFVVQRLNCAYVILGPDGAVAESGFTFKIDADRRRAELQRLADRAAKRGSRTCMCCGDGFQSEGIHNRLCKSCRHRDVAPDAPHSFSFARASGGRAR